MQAAENPLDLKYIQEQYAKIAKLPQNAKLILNENNLDYKVSKNALKAFRDYMTGNKDLTSVNQKITQLNGDASVMIELLLEDIFCWRQSDAGGYQIDALEVLKEKCQRLKNFLKLLSKAELRLNGLHEKYENHPEQAHLKENILNLKKVQENLILSSDYDGFVLGFRGEIESVFQDLARLQEGQKMDKKKLFDKLAILSEILVEFKGLLPDSQKDLLQEIFQAFIEVFDQNSCLIFAFFQREFASSTCLENYGKLCKFFLQFKLAIDLYKNLQFSGQANRHDGDYSRLLSDLFDFSRRHYARIFEEYQTIIRDFSHIDDRLTALASLDKLLEDIELFKKDFQDLCMKVEQNDANDFLEVEIKYSAGDVRDCIRKIKKNLPNTQENQEECLQEMRKITNENYEEPLYSFKELRSLLDAYQSSHSTSSEDLKTCIEQMERALPLTLEENIELIQDTRRKFAEEFSKYLRQREEEYFRSRSYTIPIGLFMENVSHKRALGTDEDALGWNLSCDVLKRLASFNYHLVDYSGTEIVCFSGEREEDSLDEDINAKKFISFMDRLKTFAHKKAGVDLSDDDLRSLATLVSKVACIDGVLLDACKILSDPFEKDKQNWLFDHFGLFPRYKDNQAISFDFSMQGSRLLIEGLFRFTLLDASCEDASISANLAGKTAGVKVHFSIDLEDFSSIKYQIQGPLDLNSKNEDTEPLASWFFQSLEQTMQRIPGFSALEEQVKTYLINPKANWKQDKYLYSLENLTRSYEEISGLPLPRQIQELREKDSITSLQQDFLQILELMQDGVYREDPRKTYYDWMQNMRNVLSKSFSSPGSQGDISGVREGLLQLCAARYLGNDLSTFSKNIVDMAIQSGQAELGSLEPTGLEIAREDFDYISQMPRELKAAKAATEYGKFRGTINQGFDPNMQANVPYVLRKSQLKEDLLQEHAKEVRFLRMGTPTIEPYSLSIYSQAHICPLFKGFLEFLKKEEKKHLYISLQSAIASLKLIGDETGRTQAIIDLAQDYPEHFDCVVFSQDSAFYKKPLEEEGDVPFEAFKKAFLEELERPTEESGYFFPKKWSSQEGFFSELGLLMDAVYREVFAESSTDFLMNFSERQDFIEIFQAFLALKCIQKSRADTVNITCKDAIDRAGKTNCLVAKILMIKEGRGKDPLALKELKTLTHAPALMVKKQAIVHSRRERLLSALSYLEDPQIQARIQDGFNWI